VRCTILGQNQLTTIAPCSPHRTTEPTQDTQEMVERVRQRLRAVGALFLVALALSALIYLSSPALYAYPPLPTGELAALPPSAQAAPAAGAHSGAGSAVPPADLDRSPIAVSPTVPKSASAAMLPSLSAVATPAVAPTPLQAVCVNVYGFQGCGYHRRAQTCAAAFSKSRAPPLANVEVRVRTLPRAQYHQLRARILEVCFGLPDSRSVSSCLCPAGVSCG
jgi:hypothetical protein